MRSTDEAFFEGLRAGDERRCVDHARRLQRLGADTATILEDLIGASQREVGERWYRNEWNVADEHIATSVSERVVAALVTDQELEDNGRVVIVGCAEGEWHALPARLVAEHLRLAGWRVVFLGASVPSNHLRELVRARPPDLIVLSCTVAFNFAGLARSIAAVRDTPAPVWVGGAAITSSEIAARLGADGWARSGPELLTALERVPPSLVRPSSSTPTEPSRVERVLPDLTHSVLQELLGASAAVRGFDAWSLARTREDLEHILRFAAASLLVDDCSVFEDFVSWTATLLQVRGVPRDLFELGLATTAGACERDLPDTAALVRGGLRHVRLVGPSEARSG